LADILIDVDLQNFRKRSDSSLLQIGDGQQPVSQSRCALFWRRQERFHTSGRRVAQRRLRVNPVQQQADLVVMRQPAPVQKGGSKKECGRDASALKDRRNNVMHFPETIIERQMKAETGQSSCSVQCIHNVGESYGFKMASEKLQVCFEFRYT